MSLRKSVRSRSWNGASSQPVNKFLLQALVFQNHLEGNLPHLPRGNFPNKNAHCSVSIPVSLTSGLWDLGFRLWVILPLPCTIACLWGDIFFNPISCLWKYRCQLFLIRHGLYPFQSTLMVFLPYNFFKTLWSFYESFLVVQAIQKKNVISTNLFEVDFLYPVPLLQLQWDNSLRFFKSLLFNRECKVDTLDALWGLSHLKGPMRHYLKSFLKFSKGL